MHQPMIHLLRVRVLLLIEQTGIDEDLLNDEKWKRCLRDRIQTDFLVI